jgi:anti-sigma regulatory factor (Ser/Thr protein kinase)
MDGGWATASVGKAWDAEAPRPGGSMQAQSSQRGGTSGEIDLAIPLSPLAPRAARAALADDAVGVPAPALGDVQLLLSELVSNSVRHSNLPPETPIHVKLLTDERRVRVEVEDQGWGFTAVPTPKESKNEGGWGLFVLSYLADRWGVERHENATRVWFEVDLD